MEAIMSEENRRDAVLDDYNKTMNDSSVDFEKQLTFIASGALGISIIFIEKIVDLEHTEFSYFLISGWIFFGLSLVLNMSSHLLTILFCSESAQEYIKDDPAHNSNVDKRNKRVRIINFVTVLLLLLGLAGTIIFLSLNIDSKKSKSDNNIKECTGVLSNEEKINKEIRMTNDNDKKRPITEDKRPINDGKAEINEGRQVPVHKPEPKKPDSGGK
jgi:hypothetical protein